jgi:NADPH:quinone reductase-like Zn-dependent oxidoreductase
LQPFDARIRREAYVKVPYPFILGATCAGTIVAIGRAVPTTFAIGDRVVSDTPVYMKHETKYGGWQKYVVGKAGLTAKVGLLNEYEFEAYLCRSEIRRSRKPWRFHFLCKPLWEL